MFLVSSFIRRKKNKIKNKIKRKIKEKVLPRNNRKIVRNLVFHNFQTRISPEIQTNAREKMRKNKLRLSRLTELHNLSVKNLIARPLKRLIVDDFAKNILFKKYSVCQRREKRRKAIMSKTHGKGMSVKKADWTSESFVRCKG